MRISDWSSDVCSSDLGPTASAESTLPAMSQASTGVFAGILTGASTLQPIGQSATAIVGMLATASSRLGRMSQASIAEFEAILTGDRKSVVSGKSVSVRVDLGGRGIIKKKKKSE